MTVPTLQFVPGDGRAARPAPQQPAELSPTAAVLARLVPAIYLSRNDSVPGRPQRLLGRTFPTGNAPPTHRYDADSR